MEQAVNTDFGNLFADLLQLFQGQARQRSSTVTVFTVCKRKARNHARGCMCGCTKNAGFLCFTNHRVEYYWLVVIMPREQCVYAGEGAPLIS